MTNLLNCESSAIEMVQWGRHACDYGAVFSRTLPGARPQSFLGGRKRNSSNDRDGGEVGGGVERL